MLSLNFNVSALDLKKVDLDLEEILDEASAFLLHRILTRFLSETDPSGKPWIPSKAGMARRLEGTGGTLLATRRLFNSIQVYKDGEGARRISTDVPYAAKHNFGTDGMVKREFMGFNEEDSSLVYQIVEMRIAEQLKKG